VSGVTHVQGEQHLHTSETESKEIGHVCMFNRLNYILLLLRLCILIVMYALFCILCFHRANWHSSVTLTEVSP